MHDFHYTLNRLERLSLEKSEGDNRVIAASPWVKGRGESAHRIVIRDIVDEFAVHTEVVADHYGSRPYYHGGMYYRKTSFDALERAWVSFDSRVRTMMEITRVSNALS